MGILGGLLLRRRGQHGPLCAWSKLPAEEVSQVTLSVVQGVLCWQQHDARIYMYTLLLSKACRKEHHLLCVPELDTELTDK